MIAWAIGWQELPVILALCIIPMPGPILFVVGRTLKKRGLWIAGLILMVVTMALMFLGIAALLLSVYLA